MLACRTTRRSGDLAIGVIWDHWKPGAVNTPAQYNLSVTNIRRRLRLTSAPIPHASFTNATTGAGVGRYLNIPPAGASYRVRIRGTDAGPRALRAQAGALLVGTAVRTLESGDLPAGPIVVNVPAARRPA